MTDATTTKKPDDPSDDTAVVKKLRAHKAKKTGSDSFTLPETGIKATWPKFKPHHIWTKAQRLAKRKQYEVMDIYLVLLCKFDNDRMTIEEFKELMPTNDILDLTSEVMGDDDDEDDNSGNALH